MMSLHPRVFAASVTVEASGVSIGFLVPSAPLADELLSPVIVTVETGDVSIGSLAPSASLVGKLLFMKHCEWQ